MLGREGGGDGKERGGGGIERGGGREGEERGREDGPGISLTTTGMSSNEIDWCRLTNNNHDLFTYRFKHSPPWFRFLNHGRKPRWNCRRGKLRESFVRDVANISDPIIFKLLPTIYNLLKDLHKSQKA